MTVGTTPPRAEYVEDGATLVHAVPFQFFDPDELTVTRIDGTSDANERTLTLDVDYTVAGGAGDVGSITKMDVGTIGATLRITRDTHRSQLAHYEPGDDFPAAQHEEALDRLEMQIQELADQQLDAEKVRDIVAALLKAGAGIAIEVDDALNTITISALDALDFPDCVMLSGDQQAWEGVGDPTGAGGLSSEDVQDIVASMLTAGAGISAVYDDATNTFTITNAAPDTPGLTNENVQDIVAGFLQAGANVALTYNDAANTLTIESSAAGGGADPAALTLADETLDPASGHYKLSDGFMFQWGVANVPANSSPTIFYEVPFTTFGVPSGSGRQNTTANPNNCGIVGSSPAGFTVANNSPNAVNFYWHAMGK